MTEEKPAYRKKLIEVAMPLDIINKASKSKGYFTGIHLWWARRPLAAAKAVILASLIDDPSNDFPLKQANKVRKEYFKKIEKIIKPDVNIEEKHLKSLFSINKELPVVFDPFSGGGCIPLAALSLGLKSQGSDLNPVATLISKSLVELPQNFINKPAVNPSSKNSRLGTYKNFDGLCEDIKYYGKVLNDRVFNKVKSVYPAEAISENTVGFLWAKSVRCPNPACNIEFPLLSSYWLSKKPGNSVYLEPKIERGQSQLHFEICVNKKEEPKKPPKVSRGANFICPVCLSKVNGDYIKSQGINKRLGNQYIALITKQHKQIKFLAPIGKQPKIPEFVNDDIKRDLPYDPRNIWCPAYGLTTFKDLFTERQAFVLTAFTELMNDIHKEIVVDTSRKESKNKNDVSLEDGGKGNKAYADAVVTYLSFAIGKLVNWNSAICSWNSQSLTIRYSFARQAIPMVWDYVEAYPFSNGSGSYLIQIDSIVSTIHKLPVNYSGIIKNLDSSQTLGLTNICPMVSTDPPYYDNISYAGLSDFFYIWLRKSLSKIWPNLFATTLTPKQQELIANPYLYGGNKEKATKHFQEGIEKTFRQLSRVQNKDYPLTIFYAFKQMEKDEESHSCTGWETMLDSILNANLQIVGTWPLRTETEGRMVSVGTNALASSIVIVCRPRQDNVPISTRRDFINTLKKELPSALKNLQEAGIAPVDMAQSAIGPGMAVFSRYSKVLEADGNPMRVRTALQIINKELDAYFTEQESDMDKETRFCIAWYEQFGWKEGPFGDANTLATAKGTAVNALEQAGVIYAKAGKVRLLKRTELDNDWDPTTDKKLTVWECVQYLIKALEDKGEVGAAEILKKIGGLSESVKELAYRLYALSEKKGWTEDGLAYNALISSWQSVTDKAQFGEQVSEETKKNLKDKSQKTLHDI